MRNPQVFFNLFRNSSYLLISGIGMTFVILTGGIDLSVSGVVALTTVASAVLLREGWNAWVVILLMLADGHVAGRDHGQFHCLPEGPAVYRHPGGMWFARGMCFFISDDAVRSITHLSDHWERQNPDPGLDGAGCQTGEVRRPYISIPVVVAFTC
jgi:ribose/xylose/arabinose/galactoside ABC-type transport system permease subunit